MTDELTAEQEAAVRRLLAQARHDAPVPADIAARLDATLDELVATEGADDLEIFEADRGVVTELAGVRRRRRNAGRLLLAAAAVIVGGVAVGQNLGSTGLEMGGADDSGDADTALAEPPRASSSRADQESAAGGDSGVTAEEDGPVPADGAAESDLTFLLQSLRAPLELTSDNFAADVQRELLRTGDQRREAANADYDGLAAYAESDPTFECAAGPYGEGAKLPAYYDAEEAVLVLRKPRSGIQHVDLLTCGTAVTLNSLDLPTSP